MYYLLFMFTLVFSFVFGRCHISFASSKKRLNIASVRDRKTKTRKDLLLWIILGALPFIYLAAQRDFSIGTDTSGTYQIIYYYGYAQNNWHVPLYESVYIYFVKLVYLINSEYRFLLFLTSAIISIGFISYFLKREKEFNTSIALSGFLVLIYCFSLNGQRQGLAMVLSLLFFIFLENNKPLRAFAILIIIAFVHITGLVLIIYYIPYFFKNLKHAQRIIPAIFFFGPLLLPAVIYIVTRVSLFSKFQSFINAFSIQTINTKYFVFPVLMLPLIVFYWNKLTKLRKSNFMHMCGYVSIFSAILLSGYLWYAFRIMYYFIPSEIIIVSQLDKCCHKRQKILVNTYILASLLIYFVFVYVMHDTDSIYPYMFGR